MIDERDRRFKDLAVELESLGVVDVEQSPDGSLQSHRLLAGDGRTEPGLGAQLHPAGATAPVEILDPFRKVTIDERKFDMAFLRHHAAEATVAIGLALRRPGDKSS